MPVKWILYFSVFTPLKISWQLLLFLFLQIKKNIFLVDVWWNRRRRRWGWIALRNNGVSCICMFHVFLQPLKRSEFYARLNIRKLNSVQRLHLNVCRATGVTPSCGLEKVQLKTTVVLLGDLLLCPPWLVGSRVRGQPVRILGSYFRLNWRSCFIFKKKTHYYGSGIRSWINLWKVLLCVSWVELNNKINIILPTWTWLINVSQRVCFCNVNARHSWCGIVAYCLVV